MSFRREVVAACAALGIAACASNNLSATPPASTLLRSRTATPIQHVVFIVQENRSFNNLFLGYPGATTQAYGYEKRGRKVRVHAADLGTAYDVRHNAQTFFADCDGRGSLPGTDCKMDGWIAGQEANSPRDSPFAYVKRKQIAPYWELARHYVLADRMFSSNLDGSFIAHQYVVAAYAKHAVDWPIGEAWGCEGGKTDTVLTLLETRAFGPPIRACFGIPTLADEADAAAVTWRFYASAVNQSGGEWSSFQADRKIYYGSDWSSDVVNPAPQFITDVANGKLANITWITPMTWEASDHPGLFGKQGPKWVASLVDAIGTSKFWNSTAIFIVWDDWGGWFDPVPPVYEDYDGLGFRVPLIIVSPYAKKGYVTHVQYETASVLRYIEDNFGLKQLAASDARANDPATDAFDYRRKPRPFTKISGAEPVQYWLQLERHSPSIRRTDAADGD
jgi:phospholipase C